MTVSAIEFTRLGAPKLHLFAMKCGKCKELSPWWERSHCYKCGHDTLTEVVCARVRLTVARADGQRGEGWAGPCAMSCRVLRHSRTARSRSP